MQCPANNSRAKILACFRIAYRNGIFRGLERYASILGTVSDMYVHFYFGWAICKKDIGSSVQHTYEIV